MSDLPLLAVDCLALLLSSTTLNKSSSACESVLGDGNTFITLRAQANPCDSSLIGEEGQPDLQVLVAES